MIAPPPTAPNTMSYNNQPATGTAPTIFNRYVPYDLNNSQPPTYPVHQPSPYVAPAPVYPSAVPPTAPVHPPLPTYSYPPNQPVSVPNTATTQSTTPSSAPSTPANKLLGNKSIIASVDNEIPTIISHHRRADDRKTSYESPKKLPSTEDEVITANASSSSIL